MDLIYTKNESDDVRIRPVKALHVGDLIRIADATNLSPWTAQCYLDEMRNDDSVMLRLVAWDNSTIGFVVGRLVAGGEVHARLDAEIYNIAVNEPMQGRGLGQLLFDAFLAVCSEREVENIWLEVRESNEKALRFYARNGFAKIQTRRHFYHNPREHAVLMRCVLK